MTVLVLLLGGLLAAVAWPQDRQSHGSGTGSRPRGGAVVPAEPAEAGAHRFLQVEADGTPGGWDPCRPIPYWIGTRDLPEYGRDLITWVLAEVTGISGQQFEFRGYSQEVPADALDFPVDGAWIGWTSELSTEAWQASRRTQGGSPAGLAVWNIPGADGWHTRGWAMVKADRTGREPATDAGLLRHEVGHLLGLDHVASAEEVMGVPRNTTEFGPGDRRGLWLLGLSRGCGART